MMDMIGYVSDATTKYIQCMPKVLRKKYGQFFTSKETARFMAELISLPRDREVVSFLDPGAGSGILCAALIERLLQTESIRKIECVCYENDPNILALLQSNLEWICTQTTVEITCTVLSENYILGQMEKGTDTVRKFDFVIGNPPYMKISKDAPEAKALPDVCYGAPNLYFLFAAMSLRNLKEQGEMVYIIPRSWTSGAYFKRFREKFLQEGALEHIHLFVGRDKVFEQEQVLQETMIVKAKKTLHKSNQITITQTKSNSDFAQRTTLRAPYTTVVGGADCYVHLVTNQAEVEVLNRLNQWTDTLPKLGMRMKTGLTVDFRNRNALRDRAEAHAVPLFYSQHIRNGEVVFPVGKEAEYLVTEQNGLLQKNTNYLFVKRFTSKEERRRLQCGIYLARRFPAYEFISTQNKVNFICGLREISECVVHGLYVLFNSTIYDCYYRILNGSTQVNSTEINSLPVPPLHIIEEMGRELIRCQDLSEGTCDSILRCYL